MFRSAFFICKTCFAKYLSGKRMNEHAEIREASENLSRAPRGIGTWRGRGASAARRISEDTHRSAHTSDNVSCQLWARRRHQYQTIKVAGPREPQKLLEEQLIERKGVRESTRETNRIAKEIERCGLFKRNLCPVLFGSIQITRDCVRNWGTPEEKLSALDW